MQAARTVVLCRGSGIGRGTMCAGWLEQSGGGDVGPVGFCEDVLQQILPAANESLVAPSVPQTRMFNTLSASVVWCCTCTAVQWLLRSMRCQHVLRYRLLNAGRFVMESLPYLITGRLLREWEWEKTLEDKETRICLGQGAW